MGVIPSKIAMAWNALRATKHLAPSAVAHWRTAPNEAPSTTEIRSLLHGHWAALPEIGSHGLAKGAPDLAAIKRTLAAEVESLMDGDDQRKTIEVAQQLASVDMLDSAAFRVYIGLLTQASKGALVAARSSLARDVVLHVSCGPRLQRAVASAASFGEIAGVSHVLAMGSTEAPAYHFDEASRVLVVPAADSYEHLPEKVVAAMSFLSLAGNVDSVLKVDDDHRLMGPSGLQKAFSRLKTERPVQMGKRSNSNVVGLHSRVWHFGKCANPRLNDKAYELLAPARWMDGSSGYFLNRQALRLMLWSFVYFRSYVHTGLYEDLIVSDLVERQGGRLIDHHMDSFLSTVAAY